MNVKTFSILGVCAICLASGAQQVPVFYQFTISPGYTLTDAYFINSEPQEAFAFITPLAINGQSNFPSGRYDGVFLNGTTFGNNCVTIIGVVANSSATNIGVTMPGWLADELVLTNGTWPDYTTNLHPYGNLPDAQTVISNLQSGSSFFLQAGYGYLPATNRVLQAYGQIGAVVSLDAAQRIGDFSFGLTPILSVAVGAGAVTIQWPTNASGFTLAQSADLATGSWNGVTNTQTTNGSDYSITLPIGTANSFFRLHH
jgi:hypothetical protein